MEFRWEKTRMKGFGLGFGRTTLDPDPFIKGKPTKHNILYICPLVEMIIILAIVKDMTPD